jgi:hypothetical protein
MRAAVAAVSRLVAGIPAGEELEAEDIRSALAWLIAPTTCSGGSSRLLPTGTWSRTWFRTSVSI